MGKLVAAAAGVALCTVLAGCTTPEAAPAREKDSAGPGPVRVSSASSSEPVTLRFAVYGAGPTVDAYRRLARVFTTRHPRVHVEVEVAPDADTAMAVLEEERERGRAPDVFLVPHDALPRLVQGRRVHPVDQLLEQRGVSFGDNYQRVGLEAFSAQSALQCMPHDVSPLVVYYNQDLVRPRHATHPGRRPPPSARDGWSWEQFVTAARRASHGKVEGVYLPPTLATLTALVRSAGADVMNDDRTPTSLTLSDPGTRPVLRRILAVARDPRLTPSPGRLRREDPVDLFQHGRLGMLLGTRALVPRFRDAAALRFGVMPLPDLGRFRTVASMTGYCISSTTPHLRAAADFLAYATGARGAAITTEPGQVVPANLAVLHSPAFTQPGRRPEDASVFIDSVRQSDGPPFVTGWSRLERETAPMLERLFSAREAGHLAPLLTRIDRRSRVLLASPTIAPVG